MCRSKSPEELVLSDQEKKEVISMEKEYEPPELVLIGRVDEVVLGTPSFGHDGDEGIVDPDFEYEQD
jgi:hypothetical protein